ncbi:MAG: GNAT family N-acetyltransferase [Anaerolineales bacterium]|nr:GNAT family N-acetyltransferase [Anaerolineales bacterium]
MDSDSTVIRSERLDLVPLKPDVLQFTLDGNTAAVERALGLEVPREWHDANDVVRIRLRQVTEDSSFLPWSLRAVSSRDQSQMVGHIGFHAKPGADYLEPYASNGVEFGFTVFPFFRRRGYAREACLALMDWAYQQHQVSEFILSIRPDNLPSRRLAQGLGFAQVGSWIDEEDGPEDIFKMNFQGRSAL